MSTIQNSSGETLDITFHPGVKKSILVVLGHGLTGNKDRPLLIAIAEALSARDLPCLRISFSGNGGSEGSFRDSCISKGIGDLQSVLDTVPDDVSVIYIGHSMGGAIGVLTAARDNRLRGLVTLSGMVHTADFVRREFRDVTPGEGNMWDETDHPLTKNFVNDLTQIVSTLDAAKNLTQPWLLIHGLEDDIIPAQDSRDAYAVATTRKQILEIPEADHAFDARSYPQIVETIDGWIKANFV